MSGHIKYVCGNRGAYAILFSFFRKEKNKNILKKLLLS